MAKIVTSVSLGQDNVVWCLGVQQQVLKSKGGVGKDIQNLSRGPLVPFLLALMIK